MSSFGRSAVGGYDDDESNTGGFDGGNTKAPAGGSHAASTRDFFATTTHWFGGGAGDMLGGRSGSTTINSTHLGLETLDINSGQQWPEMQLYSDFLRSGTEDTPMGPPPVQVPPRTAFRNLGFGLLPSGSGRGAATGGCGRSAGGTGEVPMPRQWGPGIRGATANVSEGRHLPWPTTTATTRSRRCR